jgi:hypothetical protein
LKKNHNFFLRKRLKNITWIQTLDVRAVRLDPCVWPRPWVADTWCWVCPALSDRDWPARLVGDKGEWVCMPAPQGLQTRAQCLHTQAVDADQHERAAKQRA